MTDTDIPKHGDKGKPPAKKGLQRKTILTSTPTTSQSGETDGPTDGKTPMPDWRQALIGEAPKLKILPRWSLTLETACIGQQSPSARRRRVGPIKVTVGAIASSGLEGVPIDPIWWTKIGPNDKKLMARDIAKYLGCTLKEVQLAVILVCWMQMPEAARRSVPGFYAAAIMEGEIGR